MNQEHLTKIWRWASLVGLLFILTSVVSLQGGSAFLGNLLGNSSEDEKKNLAGVAYFGAIIGGALLLIASSVLVLHAYRFGKYWHERLPVAWLDGLVTASWEGKLFQLIVFLLFVVTPASGIVACMIKAEGGEICEQNTARIIPGAESNLFATPPSMTKTHQMRLHSGALPQENCQSGVEIGHIITPILFYVLPFVSCCAMLTAVGLVFRRKSTEAALPIENFENMCG